MKWKILLLGLIFLVGCTDKTPQVCFDNHCVDVEISDSTQERAVGLMYRDSLKGGMLFVYPDEDYRFFWMKNVLVPLDMIWINKDNEIIYIQDRAPPCEEDPCSSYGPQDIKAQYVLELKGGYAKERSVEVGDKVKIKR